MESPLKATEEAYQMNLFVESMETYTKHKIECFLCLKSETARDTTEQRFARHLYRDGWRYVTSKKFKTIGVMCPYCAKTPDAKRGD
mgnify:CR=1 FL=1